MVVDCCVVVIGVVVISLFGYDWLIIEVYLCSCCNVVCVMFEWDVYVGLNIKLVVLVQDFELLLNYNCKIICLMGKVVIMLVCVIEVVLCEVGLYEYLVLCSGCIGVVYGFLFGSYEVIGEFGCMFNEFIIDGISVIIYLKMMSYIVLVNIGVFFGLFGCVYIIFSVCMLGSQGVGVVYEVICSGKQMVMVVGGVEQFDVIVVVVFDMLFVISVCNDVLQIMLCLFDVGCDGLVLGEGVCMLILEDLEYVQVCGVIIFVEVVGYGINSDGQYVIQFSVDIMVQVMCLVLEDVGLDVVQIDYVNVYGIVIDYGDIVEIQVIVQVFGSCVLISLLKSYVGYMLGVCGVFEVWVSIQMMCVGWFVFILNLVEVDLCCGQFDFIIGQGCELQVEYVMSNNFVFGGINILLVFCCWSE